MTLEVNVVIDHGPSDWQIIQQGPDGKADIAMAGRWHSKLWPNNPFVLARLVKEDTNIPLSTWQPMKAAADGTWKGSLKGIPAGGLYRLETLLGPDIHTQWGAIGQVRHHLGVGDLWIIAGQSNSAGYGQGPVWDPPENGVHLFNNAMRWMQASHPLNEATGTVHPANREMANPFHAPWLHWARRMKQELGYPIGLVQTSLGGSPLVSWNPTEKGEHPLFDAMVQAVNATGGKARGMLWYQGCSDCSPELSATYEKRFLSAAKAWRKALKCPNLFILTVQLNRCTDPKVLGDRNWSILREAQRQVPKKLANCCVVPALDLPMSDCIHNSAHGNLLLAERSALATLGAAYGRDVAWKAPEVAKARLMKDRTTVELTMDNVTNALTTADAMGVPFAVEDSQGMVNVTKMDLVPRNVVKLTLEREVAGQAVVHGAYGVNPPGPVFDYFRFVPMLAFHGFPISTGKEKK